MALRVVFVSLAALALVACGQVEGGAGLDPAPATPTEAPPPTWTPAPPGSTPDPSAVADMSNDMIVTTVTPEMRPTPSPTPYPLPQATNASAPGDQGGQPGEVARAQAALAAALGVAPATLVLQQVEEQEWSNSGLGCPSPDEAYMQVIIAGQRIVFSDGSAIYAVHTAGEGGRMLWCDNGRAVPLG